MRMELRLAERMNRLCDVLDMTQRELVEAALAEELADPQPDESAELIRDPIYRTGLWIDPALLKQMDKRLDKERKLRTTQRGLIERAVLRYILNHE